MLILAMTGLPLFSITDGEWWVDYERRRRFGRYLLRAHGRCANCGGRRGGIRFSDVADVVLREDRGLVLLLPCTSCRNEDPSSAIVVRGAAAEHALRRLLAYRNHRGGEAAVVRDAAARISTSDSADRFVHDIAARDGPLSRLDPATSLALEIATNDGRERALLREEIQRVRESWAREERIAAIADTDLTELPALDALRERLRGG